VTAMDESRLENRRTNLEYYTKIVILENRRTKT
jgi:hypothetical protein